MKTELPAPDGVTQKNKQYITVGAFRSRKHYHQLVYEDSGKLAPQGTIPGVGFVTKSIYRQRHRLVYTTTGEAAPKGTTPGTEGFITYAAFQGRRLVDEKTGEFAPPETKPGTKGFISYATFQYHHLADEKMEKCCLVEEILPVKVEPIVTPNIAREMKKALFSQNTTLPTSFSQVPIINYPLFIQNTRMKEEPSYQQYQNSNFMWQHLPTKNSNFQQFPNYTIFDQNIESNEGVIPAGFSLSILPKMVSTNGFGLARTDHQIAPINQSDFVNANRLNAQNTDTLAMKTDMAKFYMQPQLNSSFPGFFPPVAGTVLDKHDNYDKKEESFDKPRKQFHK